MMRLFADRRLAERIERSVVRDLALLAEACKRLDPALTAATAEFAGGLAVFLAPGSPINMIYGAGFAEPVGAREITAIEHFYSGRGTRAAISLCPLADEALVAQLGARGWMVTDFENVLVRELDSDSPARRAPVDGDQACGTQPLGLPAPDPGIELHAARSAGERARWGAISSSAFRAPEPPSAEIVRLGEAMAARGGAALLTGTVDGEDAGTGALWVDDRMGWLLSDATLPLHRRRGVQSALLAERIRLATEAGCEFAVTEARPGSTSQRNMERLGFRVVYTRVELIAPTAR